MSVCCGDGAHEIQLYTSGKVRFVSGVDISEGAIKQANGRFEAVDAPPDRYRFEVRDVNALTIDGTFDLILSTGALHHTTNLEALLATVERALEPNGYFIVVEFIGPNRFQWTDRQVEIANQVLVRKSAAALAPMMKGVTATMPRSPVAQFKRQTRGAIGRGRRLVIA